LQNQRDNTGIDCEELEGKLAKIMLYNTEIDYEDLEGTITQPAGYYRNRL